MVLKIFTQPSCPKCPSAKVLGKKAEKRGFKVEYWDISTVEGLAEASFYSVMATPSLILGDDQGKEVKSWRGEVPPRKEIFAYLK